jgi:hypothetical protein
MKIRKAINEKNIVIDGFKIWKVSIPVDEVDILRKHPSELKGGKELDDDQNMASFGKVLDDYIQVFMGHPDLILFQIA